MVAEVFGGISALKAAFDMTKALADMSDAAKRDRLSINLQKEILAAQAAQSELVEEISSLKAKLASFETWDAEKQRYELYRIVTGSTTYALTQGGAKSEPPHWICASCYEDRKRSILQYAGPAGKTVTTSKLGEWQCPRCHFSIRVPHSISPTYCNGETDDEATLER
jgi:hypothetical protein